jgi:hypothetical protein
MVVMRGFAGGNSGVMVIVMPSGRRRTRRRRVFRADDFAYISGERHANHHADESERQQASTSHFSCSISNPSRNALDIRTAATREDRSDRPIRIWTRVSGFRAIAPVCC